MIQSISIAPANSIVGIADGPTADVPQGFDPGKGVAATLSCITVICLPEVDGPTKISLGPSSKAGSNPEFSGFLDTPNHMGAVWTVEWQKLLEARVPTSRTKIRIWTNHPTEPDEVFIGLGD
jgi:hypothetical protein